MKNKVKFVLKILLIVFLAAWVFTVVMDYFRVKKGNNAMFCLKEEVRIYNSSKELEKTMKVSEFDKLSEEEKNNMSYTYMCLGLGYKVYRYHRDFNAIEFGPFFIPERQNVNS